MIKKFYYHSYGTVTWCNYDGTVLETDTAEYGSTVSYHSSTPTKASTAQYTYTFDGWSDVAGGAKTHNIGFAPVVGGDAVYYAHFNDAVRFYTVYINIVPSASFGEVYDNSEPVSSINVAYGSSITPSISDSLTIGGHVLIPTPASGYHFDTWTYYVTTITENTSIYVTFKPDT